MSTRLDPERLFIVAAGCVAAHGRLATEADIAAMARAMEAARDYMTDEIRTRIFDHCAEIVRDGPSDARASALFEMLKERISQLTQERGPWYRKGDMA